MVYKEEETVHFENIYTETISTRGISWGLKSFKAWCISLSEILASTAGVSYPLREEGLRQWKIFQFLQYSTHILRMEYIWNNIPWMPHLYPLGLTDDILWLSNCFNFKANILSACHLVQRLLYDHCKWSHASSFVIFSFDGERTIMTNYQGWNSAFSRATLALTHPVSVVTALLSHTVLISTISVWLRVTSPLTLNNLNLQSHLN